MTCIRCTGNSDVRQYDVSAPSIPLTPQKGINGIGDHHYYATDKSFHVITVYSNPKDHIYPAAADPKSLGTSELVLPLLKGGLPNGSVSFDKSIKTVLVPHDPDDPNDDALYQVEGGAWKKY